MKRLVLDTNVVFAAFAARGVCEAVFELCLERCQLIASGFLFTELTEKLTSKLKLPPDEVKAIVEFYLDHAHSTGQFPRLDPGNWQTPIEFPVNTFEHSHTAYLSASTIRAIFSPEYTFRTMPENHL